MYFLATGVEAVGPVNSPGAENCKTVNQNKLFLFLS
jgi:hypothetical protein